MNARIEINGEYIGDAEDIQFHFTPEGIEYGYIVAKEPLPEPPRAPRRSWLERRSYQEWSR